MTAFDKLHDIAPNVIWDGVIGRSLHGAEATLAAIELEPNIDVPEHAHVNEQIGILTSGLLTFRIGDEQQDLRARRDLDHPGEHARIPSAPARTAPP